MKIIISTTTALFFGLLFTAQASAVPVLHFETSLADSSVTIDNVEGWNLGNLEVELNSGLDGFAFDLEEGEALTFDFFDISLPHIGLGSAEITAQLGFLLPDVTGIGEGEGWWKSAFLFSLGGLEWVEQPGLIELADGSSFELSFSALSGIQLGTTTTVQATVRATSVSVPEPGTLALLGLGLFALGMTRRRA